MTPRIAVGGMLFVVGLVLNNYGYLHDLVWVKHGGAIFMGWRTYLMVIAGIAIMAVGVGMLVRKPKV